MVSIWPLQQTWKFGSSEIACAGGTNKKAKTYIRPCFGFAARHKPSALIHVQHKDAAIAYFRCEASDEFKRGNHLTLPELEYDTSRPAT